MTNMVSKVVKPIWSKKGKSKNSALSDQPLGATLKYIAMGMDTSAPVMAPRLVVFFQNKPKMNTAKMPGLTTPVYS